MKHVFKASLIPLLFSLSAQSQTRYPFQNTALSFEDRAENLVSLMTLKEKVAQMSDDAEAIPRLGVPHYNYHNEALHGATGTLGATTIFPQVIGLAATWNPTLIHEISTVVSDETRAIFFASKKWPLPNKDGSVSIHDLSWQSNNGLNIFAPNINIFRDPRWGRGQETYGEDPYLTSRMSVEYIKGLQGDDPKFLKLAATAKHFAVYSGPEKDSHKANNLASQKDLQETYLPAFETAVKEGHVNSVMCAYASVNGAPACANSKLLDQILRKQWGFQGNIVSDCGAIAYISSVRDDDKIKGHHYAKNPISGARAAVEAGTDLSCQGFEKNDKRKDFDFLYDAVKMDPSFEKKIDQSVTRLFLQRFKLGLFDADESSPFFKLKYNEVVDTAEHHQLARKAAQESIVLLKNQNHFLPLSKELKKIAVIGPNAHHALKDPSGRPLNILLGNYHGYNQVKSVTPLEGIKNKVSAHTQVVYRSGSGDQQKLLQSIQGSEVAILVLGIHPMEDNIEGTFANSEGEGRDRENIELPPEQTELLKAVKKTGIPVVVVLLNGSAVASVYAENHAQAILDAWYPGEEGGNAIADILFGDANPSGRLPVTFYRSTQDLPPFAEYSMQGRTYRYFKGRPLYAFGFGMNYSHFQYSNLQMNSEKIASGESLQLSAMIENTGDTSSAARAGDEVVQVYLSGPAGKQSQPIRTLKAFQKIHFEANEKKMAHFTLTPSDLALVNRLGNKVVMPGHYTVSIGGEQPGSARVLMGNFEITP